MKSITQISNLKGKKIFVRVDFNVPIENGIVQDTTRIEGALPTIKYLIEQGAIVIVASHFDRPNGKVVEEMRLNLVKESFEKLLGKPVFKFDDCIGSSIKEKLNSAQDADVFLLENLRFHEGEEACDDNFCKELAALADIYVNDAFGTSHRKHASTYGIAKILPSYPGLLLEREIKALEKVMHQADKPVALIFGGAKIETKLGMIKNFIGKADYFLLGGGLANTFLAAAGYNVADSLYEAEKLDLAREIMLEIEQKKAHLLLPKDVVVASEISEDAETLDLPTQDVEGDMKILDLGAHAIARYEEVLKEAKTIIWNGPLGLYEKTPFSKGSKAIAEIIAQSDGFTVLGGGDTIDCVKKFGLEESEFSHISTGGGAMLQYLSGETLPGIEVLKD